ncbi:uncharacterized protein EKO05_0000848 [Ascochyta rabiei]|uniref:uncharacterized protein n=1 Tax=Didymella rabiei TaxID=5454 RepID=UPI0021FEDB9B|nr:uncharacterized protein EKO05_0000848 [Ascochyta rabiei]UPX10177.1 hypothetical protein EKO05_0000848 [Ascochyta rabiei]
MVCEHLGCPLHQHTSPSSSVSSAAFACFSKPRRTGPSNAPGLPRIPRPSRTLSLPKAFNFDSRHQSHHIRSDRPHHLAMAASVNCQHSFKVVKSDTTVVVWNCNMCHSGPHSLIYECSSCKLKTCQACASKA